MPLTRNLYEIDEVVSALQRCLRRNFPAAHFWAWELVQSGEEELALNTLQQIWLEYGGGRDPMLLAITPSTPADWSSLILRIRFSSRTRMPALSLLNEVVAMDPPPVPAPATPKPSPKPFLTAAASDHVDLKLATRIWKYLHTAISAGSNQATLWALQAMQPVLTSDTIWLAINALSSPATEPAIQLLKAHASPHPESQVLHQANALLIAGVTDADMPVFMTLPEDAPAVEHYIRDWNRWIPGRRASRLQEIPVDALHKETTRGRIPSRYTNIADIRDPVAELPQGCRWWREQTAILGIHLDEEGALVFPSDDALETFYERHFPDDIPDEWSAKDQQKSHGRGTAETAPAPPPTLKIREEPATVWPLPTPTVEEITTRLSKV